MNYLIFHAHKNDLVKVNNLNPIEYKGIRIYDIDIDISLGSFESAEITFNNKKNFKRFLEYKDCKFEIFILVTDSLVYHYKNCIWLETDEVNKIIKIKYTKHNTTFKKASEKFIPYLRGSKIQEILNS